MANAIHLLNYQINNNNLHLFSFYSNRKHYIVPKCKDGGYKGVVSEKERLRGLKLEEEKTWFSLYPGP